MNSSDCSPLQGVGNTHTMMTIVLPVDRGVRIWCLHLWEMQLHLTIGLGYCRSEWSKTGTKNYNKKTSVVLECASKCNPSLTLPKS